VENKTYTTTKKQPRGILEILQDNKSVAHKIHSLMPMESGIFPNWKLRNALLGVPGSPGCPSWLEGGSSLVERRPVRRQAPQSRPGAKRGEHYLAANTC